jgi:UDP-glucose 4-epimerase
MAKVLVTGGAGFIGSHLCGRLCAEGNEVVCVDNLDAYYSPSIKRRNLASVGGKFKFVKADIRGPEALKRIFCSEDPEYVVHEAAQAGVRASLTDPLKTNEVNVAGTLSLLEALRETDARKLVFASSSSVYGKAEYLPFDEDHPKCPVSPYGASKLACEHYVRIYGELYGLKSVSLRYFTVYGPRIRPDLAIHKFAARALEGGALDVYGDGGKSRDFTHVSDAVDATVRALRKGSGPMNIGGGTRVTVKELAVKIIGLAGSGRIRYVEDQPGDAEHTASDTAKARRQLGWRPKVGFDDGLRETVEWVRGIYRRRK